MWGLVLFCFTGHGNIFKKYKSFSLAITNSAQTGFHYSVYTMSPANVWKKNVFLYFWKTSLDYGLKSCSVLYFSCLETLVIYVLVLHSLCQLHLQVLYPSLPCFRFFDCQVVLLKFDSVYFH